MGSLYISLRINGIPVMALVDSGSTLSVIHPTILSRITGDQEMVRKSSSGQLRLADGGLVDTLGTVQLSLRLGSDSYFIQHEMVVAAVEAPAVIGLDFLRGHGCILDIQMGTLAVRGNVHTCRAMRDMPAIFRISMTETVVVPPFSEMYVPGTVQGEAHFTEGLVEGTCSPLCEGNVALAKMVVNPTQGNLPLRVANLSKEPQTLFKGMEVATCESVDVLPAEDGMKADGDPNHAPGSQRPLLHLPEYMEPLVETFVSNLTDAQTQVAQGLLLEELDTFAKSQEDLGTTDVDSHRMEMASSGPVKRSRRLPLAQHQVVRDDLDRMLKLDVIEPSRSSWASPIVLVAKKDGSIRFCVDYRLVNNIMIKDSYPLPRIDDSIAALSGSRWFSTLDLASGYWQVPMDPQDADKTAFTTPYGLFQFKKMPFGLANAPATFERLMDRVLEGLHWQTCLVYLDDIIVFSQTFDQHIERLREVLKRIRAAKLKLSPQKCQLFQKKVSFLGHIVSDEGVGTNPEKTEAIDKWPRPKSVREVRSFLGLCSYYRRFVRGFADIARPLHSLTGKEMQFEWTRACENAFQKLKSVLVRPPILGYPSEHEPFVLDADASGDGLGAVLSQVQQGKERVIAYYSRVLTKTERQYCVTRRELLAVICAVKHFHHYLYGRHFVIRSDHGSLRWLLNFKNAEGQMARWLGDLGTYDYEIQHRPGSQHGNADGLSRRPCHECTYCERREKQEQEHVENECPGHRICVLKHSPSNEDGGWLEP